MDIRFLTTFIEVAKTRHFGKAAENLYLTQSAVSARIKLLEEYFHTRFLLGNATVYSSLNLVRNFCLTLGNYAQR